MEYETSTGGAKPYKHDSNRGKWESSRDFLYACVGNAFRPDNIVMTPLFVFQSLGIYGLIPYFIFLVACVEPIIFMQSFLGQFSSTGYISAFRIAPIFKGVGYVALVLNFVNLTFFSVFSAIPLDYFFHSLTPTLPWSCEGASEWMNTNYSICIRKDKDSEKPVPSVEFLRNHFSYHENDSVVKIYYSAELMICSIIVWCITTYVLLKSTESIGRFIRYSCMTIITIMSLCLFRFIFLPGATKGLWKLFQLPENDKIFFKIFVFIPLMAFSTLGPGWGSILTMASYNDFKTNIYKTSWLMCLITLGLITGMTLILIFLREFMASLGMCVNERSHSFIEFLAVPMGLTFLELPNLWSILYATILFLGSLNLLVIQLFSLLTSLFDEFENSREIKRYVIFGLVSILALVSLGFCTNHGFYFSELLSKLSVVAQIVLNLLLLVVVLAFYGSERFQLDVNFMTGITYPNWRVFVIECVGPISLPLAVFMGLIMMFVTVILHEDVIFYTSFGLICTSLLIFVLIWFLIPCYCVLKLLNTPGQMEVRCRRCKFVTDWYPADPVEKQRYEEYLTENGIVHPITIL